MSNFMIGLLTGLGVSAYIYNIMYKNTGGNTQNSLIVGASAGLFAMILVMVVLSSIF